MRKLLIIIILAIFVGSISGCSYIKLGDQGHSARPEKAVVKPVKQIPEKKLTPAQEIYKQAKDKYSQGTQLIKTGDYDQAKKLMDQALALTLADFEVGDDKEIGGKVEGLFLEVCLAQIRLGHLRGSFNRVKEELTALDFEFNPEVERWLSYYLTNGRRTMATYLARSGKYTQIMDKVLKEKGLPLELKYLPIIESGYSPYAYSPAHAAGIWQFIRGTGTRYGLRIDDWVDERRDPVKSSYAAATYLGELYAMFENWSLALASYNCGEGAVGRACKRNNSKSFWNLDLPAETVSYVPKFYAAMLIALDPELYGFYIMYEDPMDYEVVTLERPSDLKNLAALTGVSYEELKDYNPELLSQYTHPKINNYELKIPKTSYDSFTLAFNNLPDSQKYLSANQLAMVKAPGQRYGGKVVYHKVKSGESLWTIARKYKTTIAVIKKYNASARKKFLKPGTKLKIYVGRKK